MLRKVMPVMALLASGTCCAAPAACFKPAEVEAANLRVLQQQFNVAALNCQTSDPHATFATRYNQFIKSFEVQLLKNSEILVRHFGKDGAGRCRRIGRLGGGPAGHDVIRSIPDRLGRR